MSSSKNTMGNQH